MRGRIHKRHDRNEHEKLGLPNSQAWHVTRRKKIDKRHSQNLSYAEVVFVVLKQGDCKTTRLQLYCSRFGWFSWTTIIASLLCIVRTCAVPCNASRVGWPRTGDRPPQRKEVHTEDISVIVCSVYVHWTDRCCSGEEKPMNV